MKSCRATLKLTFVFAMAFFVGQSSFAAIMCPEDSCNIANGCLDGCPKISVSASVSCSNIDDATAITESKKLATTKATVLCEKVSALRSTAWLIQQNDQANECVVTSSAGFICVNSHP